MNTQEAIQELSDLLADDEIYITVNKSEALTHAIENMKRGAPEGWKLVPKEPTLEMREVAVKYVDGPYDISRFDIHDAEDVYKAMLSAAPEPPQYTRGQWQPIETAPKDGTGVLLCISIGDGHHVQYTGSYHDGHWWVTNFSGEDEYWYTPTDWRPLDEPPQESTTKASGALDSASLGACSVLPFQAEPRKD